MKEKIKQVAGIMIATICAAVSLGLIWILSGTRFAAVTAATVTTGNASNSISVRIVSLSSTSAAETTETVASGGMATVEVAIYPENTTDQRVDYALSWQDNSSEWATGKDVADYMTVTPTEDGALTATLSCSAAFSEPINLTVTSRSDPDVFDMVQLDYVMQPVWGNVKATFDDFGDTIGIEIPVDWGDGTVMGDVTVKAFHYYIRDDFVGSVNDMLSDISIEVQPIGIAQVAMQYWSDGDIYYYDGSALQWSDIICNFDDFSDEEKSQIYAAWYTAYKDVLAHRTANCLFDVDIEYSYAGTYLSGFSESDIIAYLSGDADGYDCVVTAEDVTSNASNIVFSFGG